MIEIPLPLSDFPKTSKFLIQHGYGLANVSAFYGGGVTGTSNSCTRVAAYAHPIDPDSNRPSAVAQLEVGWHVSRIVHPTPAVKNQMDDNLYAEFLSFMGEPDGQEDE